MGGPVPGKKEWDLSPQAFSRLLEFLDPDRQRAGECYQKIREKLVRFFEWKGCVPGEDYADETIDRVARRLEEGIEPRPEKPYLYFHGTALNVIRERWRNLPRDPQSLQELPEAQAPAVDPHEAERRLTQEQETERRLACLQDCLDRLPPASRELLAIYHLGGSGVRIGSRKDLAQRLKTHSAALRLRVYRIRRHLEKCMLRCLAGKVD